MPCSKDQHEAWKNSSSELTQFATEHLINRPDKSVIHRGPMWRAEAVPTAGAIAEVYANDLAIALYTTSKDGTCLWVALDLDNHGDDAAEDNLRKAVATINLWTERSILAVLEDSDGQGGFHLWVIFERPIPVAEAYRFIRFASTHLGPDDTDPERFPKQANAKGHGNGLRIPGKHHKRDHYSRFWGDGEWLEGQEGIDLWLNAPLNSPDILQLMGDYDPRPESKPRAVKPKWENHHLRPAGGTVVDKAQALIQQLYTWETLLPQYGWTPGRREGDWLHPAASSLCSASIHEESGMLYVFSSNAGLPHAHGGTEKPIYSMWRFWVFMNGFDDSRQRDAAKEFLRRAGR
ncbi:MAG: hypothetical protein NXI04_29505 [Planctomycetaceae bacterium]|nr:hypothetical protein [Planctomycetaceae bacterium]